MRGHVIVVAVGLVVALAFSILSTVSIPRAGVLQPVEGTYLIGRSLQHAMSIKRLPAGFIIREAFTDKHHQAADRETLGLAAAQRWGRCHISQHRYIHLREGVRRNKKGRTVSALSGIPVSTAWKTRSHFLRGGTRASPMYAGSAPRASCRKGQRRLPVWPAPRLDQGPLASPCSGRAAGLGVDGSRAAHAPATAKSRGRPGDRKISDRTGSSANVTLAPSPRVETAASA